MLEVLRMRFPHHQLASPNNFKIDRLFMKQTFDNKHDDSTIYIPKTLR